MSSPAKAVKLVKARPKAVEYIEDWEFCCDEYRDAVQAFGEFTVDLADISHSRARCRFCGYMPKDKAVIVRRFGTPYCTPLALLDLDEGPTS